MQKNTWIIMKFGGTSVSSLECWLTIESLVKKRQKEGLKPLLVCSALSGVSSLLSKLTEPNEKSPQIILEVIEKHRSFCQQLSLPSPLEEYITEEITTLKQLSLGVSLLKIADERVSAKILALGEMMLTKLAFAWLEKRKLSITWLDARQLLTTLPCNQASGDRRFLLSNSCDTTYSEKLEKHLRQESANVFLTQGFIARTPQGETAILGRGGSDCSASYLGAKLSACRVEIWTDVPGLFTANPKEEPQAKLLKSLDYREAQELASSGAKVLHPKSIEPVEKQNIPLHICWTQNPEMSGTVIDNSKKATKATVKAVTSKKNVHLISMDSMNMWQQSGFLADVFTCFKRHQISIDLIATSQSNISVTLDLQSNALNQEYMNNLFSDLKSVCHPKLIGPCGVVSIVGSQLRSLFDELSQGFEYLHGRKVYLLTQAASDLNLSFVVKEDDVDFLVSRLHQLFLSDTRDKKEIFGKTWQQLFANSPFEKNKQKTPWWEERAPEIIELSQKESPLYIYNLDEIKKSINELKKLEDISRINYAVKANPHPQIIKLMAKEGLSFDCVSIFEIDHLFNLIPDIKPQRIVFTPNFSPLSEYKKALSLGCYVTIDNLYLLKNHADIFENHSILLRIDPEMSGHGHHKHVQTAGIKSKFGMSPQDLDEVIKITKKYHIKIVGLHAHVGSGIKNAESWTTLAIILAQIAKKIPSVEILDLGGGFFIAEKPHEKDFSVKQAIDNFRQISASYPQYKIWVEPGRFLVAKSGALVGKVTQLKDKMSKNYLGIDVGMNSLIRYPLYGSYHHIENLNQLNPASAKKYDIVGPICESGDILGHDRYLSDKTKEGDSILIANTGAYGHSMASNYNLRHPAKEIFI